MTLSNFDSIFGQLCCPNFLSPSLPETFLLQDMSTAVESEPFFRARAIQLGISSAAVDALNAANLATYGAFAFLVPYVAGTDLAVLKDSLRAILGVEPAAEVMPIWRRLQFEAHTHVLSDAKSRIDRTDAAEPRRIPMPEKAARLAEQRRRLTHLEITPDLEPSHSLIDYISQMVEDGVLCHISLDRCTSRRQEMSQIKREPAISIERGGSLRIATKVTEPEADVSTAYAIREAFHRRSLALDQCRVVSYAEHEKWINHLFSQLHVPPPQGYNKVTVDQLLQADLEIFALMALDCREGLALTAAGVYPVENSLKARMYSPQVTFAMLPLPHAAGGRAGKGKRALEANADTTEKPLKKGKGKGKPKGSPGKSKASSPKPKGGNSAEIKAAADVFAAHEDLKNMWHSIRGAPLCARYQLGTCPEQTSVTPGSSCAKGVHLCCVPHCFKKHSMQAHPK
jgi:hypothetical protein